MIFGIDAKKKETEGYIFNDRVSGCYILEGDCIETIVPLHRKNVVFLCN